MKLRKNVALSESGLLFNPVSGESFTVNPIGVEILTMIRDGKSREDILDHILEKYSTDRSTVEKDYHDFVGLLLHNNLLESHEEANA
ncbi:MAG TPA: PqqD family protein [Bacteroidales bacterium]|nr:PqqD family protein [Bacteroidales bacterium]HPS61770.1 PqqD family protein [Bacteroidales bacterium]